MKSFYLPEFGGMKDVDKCADIETLDLVLAKARESRKVLSELIAAIGEKKRVIETITFIYRIEYSNQKTCHVVSVVRVPSDPWLNPFRVDGSYTECYSKIDARSRAKNLVYAFGEKGIKVEMYPEMFE